jgi:hypothetical protein
MHYNSIGTTDFVVQSVSGQISGCFSTPAYFNGRIYYCGSGFSGGGQRLKSFAISNSVLQTSSVLSSSRSYSYPGTTPSISANGMNDGIVWTMSAGNPAVLSAYNAVSFGSEIYNSTQAAASRDRLANSVKFTLPTIANGKVFAAGQRAVSAFGLLDSYDNWRYAHFGTNATNVIVSGDLADPDGDGAANLLEFAVASDPNAANADGALSADIQADQILLHFSRNTAASDLTYVVQVIDSPGGTWTNVATYTSASGWAANVVGPVASESAPEIVPPDRFVNVIIADPTASDSPGASGKFYRLEVL